jgi:hypothetical protein
VEFVSTQRMKHWYYVAARVKQWAVEFVSTQRMKDWYYVAARVKQWSLFLPSREFVGGKA